MVTMTVVMVVTSCLLTAKEEQVDKQMVYMWIFRL